jgi:hypothetical protein
LKKSIFLLVIDFLASLRRVGTTGSVLKQRDKKNEEEPWKNVEKEKKGE